MIFNVRHFIDKSENGWYQEIEFLISKNHFIDTKNTIFDIRKYLNKFKTATNTPILYNNENY